MVDVTKKITLYKRYKPDEFPKYDNYDAIDISVVNERGIRRGSVNYIPLDYDGVMGVPITFYISIIQINLK